MMTMLDTVLGRPVELVILEDNQATIKVVKRGYSAKLRHILRTHKVNLGSIKEILDNDNASIEYCPTAVQAADVFTKALPPLKWPNALDLLGIEGTGKAEHHSTVPLAPSALSNECASASEPVGECFAPPQSCFNKLIPS